MDKFKVGDVVRIADVESTRNPRRGEHYIEPGHTAEVVNLLDRPAKQIVVVVLKEAPQEGKWSFHEEELEAA